MESNLHVLITGYAKPELEELRIMLSHLAGLNTSTLLANPSHDDPLYGVNTLPDVLILFLGQRAEAVLRALAAKPMQHRPTTLVISTIGDNAALMRLAMQAGVRDFYPYPVLERELVETLKQVVREKSLKASGQHSQIFAVVNAKNGSGASMIAGNLAHITAVHEQVRVALMDMDMQFGTQALNFNVHPQQGLFETLPVIDGLDSMALNSFMTVHKSGLSLLTTLPNQIGLPGDLPVPLLKQLLDLMMMSFKVIVIDLPRLVDPIMSCVVDHADKLVVCVQQDVANLRDAQRLLRILQQDMEVPEQRIIIAVNRYQAISPIQLDDIQQSLKVAAVYSIPNDYARVSHVLNLGVPLLEQVPNAPITQALVKLTKELLGIEQPVKKNLMRDFFARLAK